LAIRVNMKRHSDKCFIADILKITDRNTFSVMKFSNCPDLTYVTFGCKFFDLN